MCVRACVRASTFCNLHCVVVVVCGGVLCMVCVCVAVVYICGMHVHHVVTLIYNLLFSVVLCDVWCVVCDLYCVVSAVCVCVRVGKCSQSRTPAPEEHQQVHIEGDQGNFLRYAAGFVPFKLL